MMHKFGFASINTNKVSIDGTFGNDNGATALLPHDGYKDLRCRNFEMFQTLVGSLHRIARCEMSATGLCVHSAQRGSTHARAG